MRDGRSGLNYAVYHDRYGRTPGGWKFTERVYEVRYLDRTPLAGSAPRPVGAPADRVGASIAVERAVLRGARVPGGCEPEARGDIPVEVGLVVEAASCRGLCRAHPVLEPRRGDGSPDVVPARYQLNADETIDTGGQNMAGRRSLSGGRLA